MIGAESSPPVGHTLAVPSTPGLFAEIFEQAAQAQLVLGTDGGIMLANARARQLLDRPAHLLVGRRLEELFSPDAGQHLVDLTSAGRAQSIRLRIPGHRELPATAKVTALTVGADRFAVVTILDRTERGEQAALLAHDASHDSLTGLLNRGAFMARLEHALARARRTQRMLAVLFLDLDDFKLVNDTRGHDTGDMLLTALAPSLRAALRESDTLARFGGDEFVVLCEDLHCADEPMAVAQRIAAACSTPVRIGEVEHVVSLSAGVALARDPGKANPSALLRDADAAMYRAKSAGKGRVALFDERMRGELVQRVAIESSLRKALHRGELGLLYQPMVSLETGRVRAAEALVRWRHPQRGLLAPETFLEVAESSGLILQIGEWVLEEACRRAAAWQPEIEAPISVAVNLSRPELLRDDLEELVRRALSRAELEPELLELEIPESFLRESDSCGERLRALGALGVRLVVDDFGTGHSSFSDLKRLAITGLKIDRSLIEGLGPDGTAGPIVGAVLNMARALEMEVTAQGVERVDQLEQLRRSGCDAAQGYLLGPPAHSGRIASLGGGRPAPGLVLTS